MQRLAVLAWCMVVWLASTATAQSTWFVDVHATPPGNGRPLTPFTTLADAIAAAEDLDTIRVLPGFYPGGEVQVVKRLKLRSTGGPAVTSIPGVALMPPVAFLADDGELVGFTIRGSVRAQNVSETTIRRCVIEAPGGSTSWGVALGYDAGCNVSQCVISGFQSAFGGGFGMRPRVTNTIFFNCPWVLQNSGGQGSGTSFTYCVGVTQQHPSYLFGHGLNPSGDPGLWNPTDGDFRPAPNSICIDAGDPLAALDPDGSRADIGAFVYDPGYAPQAANYCTAQVNSAGCTPQITATGFASASSPAPFVVSCSNVLNDRSGIAFYGFAPLADHPFKGGYLCVQGLLCRTPAQLSGGGGSTNPCAGGFSLDFNELIRSGEDPLLTPGRIVYAQYWSRDSAAAHGTNLSAALSFGVAP